MSAHITQRAVQQAVAGAIKGGMKPGSFRLRIDAVRGVIDVLPMTGSSGADSGPDNELDAEIKALMDGEG